MPGYQRVKNRATDTTKELYRELRAYSAERLWSDEVPAFDCADPAGRSARVALVRAVGVVFSETGTEEQKREAGEWLLRLLGDPDEKIRRYAMTALPKVAPGEATETALLSLLAKSPSEREKKFLGQSLEKVGGEATLAIADDGPMGRTTLKVRANVARKQDPGGIRLDAVLLDPGDLQIHLHCRAGLEPILEDELHERASRKFDLSQRAKARLAITPIGSFRLADLLELRCFSTLGLVLGSVADADDRATIDGVAKLIASSRTRQLFDAFTSGPIRYRLEFLSRGHRRGLIRGIGDRVFDLCPRLLNDSRDATWQVDIRDTPSGCSVELRPRLRPDPRFAYRGADVPAASHPPLAACLARLAGPAQNERVWDPFCGSGLELVERALLGGIGAVFGSDRSAAAADIARANFAAALPEATNADFSDFDFRDAEGLADWGARDLTLIITNPPMGRRVPIPDLPGLIGDLFAVAASVLRPGGRLVLANPLSVSPSKLPLKLQFRQKVDLGGFHCHLEKYVRL